MNCLRVEIISHLYIYLTLISSNKQIQSNYYARELQKFIAEKLKYKCSGPQLFWNKYIVLS